MKSKNGRVVFLLILLHQTLLSSATTLGIASKDQHDDSPSRLLSTNASFSSSSSSSFTFDNSTSTTIPTYLNTTIITNAFTPNISVVNELFGTDVHQELPHETLLTDAIQFEWQRLLRNVSMPSLFVVCASKGREGIAQMMQSSLAPHHQQNGTTDEKDWLPVFTSSNLTCFILSTSTAQLINQTITYADIIKYSMPIFSPLKLAKGFFRTAVSGQFSNDPEKCRSGLHVLLGRGGSGQGMQEFLEKVKRDLGGSPSTSPSSSSSSTAAPTSSTSSSSSPPLSSLNTTAPPAAPAPLQQQLNDGFLWAHQSTNSTSSTTAYLPSNTSTGNSTSSARGAEGIIDLLQSTYQKRPHLRGNRWDKEGEPTSSSSTANNNASYPPPSSSFSKWKTERAHQWWSRIQMVLNGSVTCNWSALTLTGEAPYIKIKGYCDLDADYNTTSTANATYLPLATSAACLTTFLAYLSSHPTVLYIEAKPIIKPTNVYAGGITQSASITNFPLWDAGLTGEGQVIQVADSGLDMESCWFKDETGNVPYTDFLTAKYDLTRRKVVQYVGWTDTFFRASGHGSHVCGSVAGVCADGLPSDSSSLDAQYKGMAYGAKIAFYDGGSSATGVLSFPSNMKLKLFPPGYQAGARIHSNSWGATTNSYTFYDVEYDTYMASSRESLIITAAGNAGNLGENTVYSPGLSKNALTIGASMNLRDTNANISYMAYFSGQGPTADGRIKPDVVAPGRSVLSADAGAACAVITKMGTSMATPIVSGGAALIRQYLMEGYYPSGYKTVTDQLLFPSGALIKAMIINSAVPMHRYPLTSSLTTGAYVPLGLPPDNYQGFGRVQLDQVLNLAGSVSLWLKDSVPIAQGETHTYKFSIPKGTSNLKPFKVTLTWTEPAASLTSSNLVLFNLDLLMSTGKVTHYPNGLTTADSKNTVEKIVEYHAVQGDVYTVSVKGTLVSLTATQDYAIVASGSFFSGAWYCQSPLSSRIDTTYRTGYCALACQTYNKKPICCSSEAGSSCTPSAANSKACESIAKPWDCFSPTPSPTKFPTKKPTFNPTSKPTPSPTRRPTFKPTPIPTARPTKKSTGKPTKTPTKSPTIHPTLKPTPKPSVKPTSKPTLRPSVKPTSLPTLKPTLKPSAKPTMKPTLKPTSLPTHKPSIKPTSRPTLKPSPAPSLKPTPKPTLRPTLRPSSTSTIRSTIKPTAKPIAMPSRSPTHVPTLKPTLKPSSKPSLRPSSTPTIHPTIKPTARPTAMPSRLPTHVPTLKPSPHPTQKPTSKPTSLPTIRPTIKPTAKPTAMPSRSPTHVPTLKPTLKPSSKPSLRPSSTPTIHPTIKPTARPTHVPTLKPSPHPTQKPTSKPTSLPTIRPTIKPTAKPIAMPSRSPTHVPTLKPTLKPSSKPSLRPSSTPTIHPTIKPTARPTAMPSRLPTHVPTLKPSPHPTQKPTSKPTSLPTIRPTIKPTAKPTAMPSRSPTHVHTLKPTAKPTLRPTLRPSSTPTIKPTSKPTSLPTIRPTIKPTAKPSPLPTHLPTLKPTPKPIPMPYIKPTSKPTSLPTIRPTIKPTARPSSPPTHLPTIKPTAKPSPMPSIKPTSKPTSLPTIKPTLKPSPKPSSSPTHLPTIKPTPKPTSLPIQKPSLRPTSTPTLKPTLKPSPRPSSPPTRSPTHLPTLKPTLKPLPQSTQKPSSKPTSNPTIKPTLKPSPKPTSVPTLHPTVKPTLKPSPQPSSKPTQLLTISPTLKPSPKPSPMPSVKPTATPIHAPSLKSTSTPTINPTTKPSSKPFPLPTHKPSLHPTSKPTIISSSASQEAALPAIHPSKASNNEEEYE